ncbi:MEKHLA domain-containing protein [Paenibacillus sp. NEAU-GSW1]|uniref:MEKHLA domain-containing protein n=1 Tax=Paenibacillus sp. NEAU-GSW1 TaxID=2682486 RepID=UPI0012E0D0CA|nr:MEKHLA domain-containing protein [Paenibacillus sp. NEAU-GSW1]MUT65243.1 MEKHLA domain-containing protein [Paenibacillus sp. NEAU-GSW1]
MEKRNGIGATEAHARLLMDSYKRWTGRDLLVAKTQENGISEALFQAPFVILSHGTEAEPVLNYGNEKALELWEMSWDELTSTPSRLTAEPMAREERDRFFERVTENGFVDGYTGIRISSTGRRFAIIDTLVWNLVDEEGVFRGQAAAFSEYRYL